VALCCCGSGPGLTLLEVGPGLVVGEVECRASAQGVVAVMAVITKVGSVSRQRYEQIVAEPQDAVQQQSGGRVRRYT
jgi:hypothetical protein